MGGGRKENLPASLPFFPSFFFCRNVTSLFTTTTPHGEVFLSPAIALGNSNSNHGNLLPSDKLHTVPRKMP